MRKAVPLIIGLSLVLVTVHPFTTDCLNVMSYVPSSERHIAELNSPMPYIAGFHVNSDNLTLREVVNATAITVSFGATDPHFFPADSWIAGGMFVQGQDTHYRNVDYGFYMMLTVDSSSRLFIDLGLHQTEEANLPNHTPRSSLVYSYSWQIIGAGLSDELTLEQQWIDGDRVQYSVSTSTESTVLATVNVRGFENCQYIISKFYAGNVIVDPFPLSRYVNYFQFGVISNRVIADPHWQVKIEQPRMLRKTGWAPVAQAWLLKGSYAYLDHDLMWGGTDYAGVDVTLDSNDNSPLAIFHYSGKTAVSGIVLWKVQDEGQAPNFAYESMDLASQSRRWMVPLLILVGITLGSCLLLIRKKRTR